MGKASLFNPMLQGPGTSTATGSGDLSKFFRSNLRTFRDNLSSLEYETIAGCLRLGFFGEAGLDEGVLMLYDS